MNKNRIDEILNAAFGEAQSEIGQLDSADRKEYEQARLIKQGLTALRDVPECQLSNERLRNAILGQAVKPRRFQSWTLGTAIAACAAAVLVFNFVQRPTQPESIVKSDPERDIVASNAEPSVSSGSDIASSEVLTSRVEGKRNSTKVTAPATTTVEPSYRQNKGALDEFIMAPVAKDGRDTVMVTPAADVGSEEPEPLVVVDPSSRTAHGAAKATELQGYGDVVFGG